MLAVKLLWRNWRSGELTILSLALVLAVSVVSAINVLTVRLEQALELQGQTLLAANRVIQSSQPFDSRWSGLAAENDLKTATTTEFASMVFAGEAMHLASVKAVSSNYPLLGTLKVSFQPFAGSLDDVDSVTEIPAPGEAWVDSRLLPLMGLSLGDPLEVGERRLTVTRVLIEEPDRGGGIGAVGARVLMNEVDMVATEVIQPGSRVRYRLLLAGNDTQLDRFESEVLPLMTDHHRFVQVEDRQQGLARSLRTGKRFLLLTAMMAVMLAGVAIAITGRAFSQRQVSQVALLKSLGAGRRQIRALYSQQMLTLGLLCSLLGVGLGAGLQQVIVFALADLFPLITAPVSWIHLLPGIATGLLCLLGFTLPSLWFLPDVPPVTILRRDSRMHTSGPLWQALAGLMTLLLLTALFSRDGLLIVAMAGAVIILVALGMLMAYLLRGLLGWMEANGAGWRLALAALRRNPVDVTIQIMVFGIALMLLLTLAGLKTSLISDWQRQLPADAPNHFLFNITSAEQPQVASLLQQQQLSPRPFYPMVRARLTHIDGRSVKSLPESTSNVLRREVNLSWATQPGEDNEIIQGEWWPDDHPAQEPLVSVEVEVAEELGLELGDQLRFSVGGLKLEAQISSIRSVKWESMNPNFYFLLTPGALEDFAPMALTSVYIPPDKKVVINDILKNFPTVVVIEMDRVIAHIQSIVDQVSVGVAWMLWVVLAAGGLVLWAAVNGSLEARYREKSLIRALGAGRRLVLSSIAIEFALIGLAAAILAVFAAEGLIWGLQAQVLEIAPSPHGQLWGLGVGAGVVLVTGLGVLACHKVTNTPPMGALRNNE